MTFCKDAMTVGDAFGIDAVKKEARLLSLAASAVFLGAFTVFVLAWLAPLPDPLMQFIDRKRFLLLLAPVVIPIAAIVRLSSLRISSKARLPFVDCWLVHVLILIPYSILLRMLVSS